MTMLPRLLIGAIAAAVIALAAHRARALTGSGAIAAWLVGTASVAAGWSWAVMVIGYFVASSALSRIGVARRSANTAGVVEKSGPRDATQVFANGAPFVLAAIGLATGHFEAIFAAAAAGSLAASAADTWSTEIGTLVGQGPRSILTGRPLTPGQSGGVTVAGTAAGVAGAAFVATLALLPGLSQGLFLPVLAAGIVGTIVDSLAGAALQRRMWCDACEASTEMPTHHCGALTRHTGGLAFVGNDGVNLVATVSGAVVGAMLQSART